MPTQLEQAVAHIKAGEIEKGRQLLVEVLKQNPRDENAWLWMTKCVTDAEQKRYCFDKVLQINPQNQHAIEGLKRLNNPVSPNTQPKVVQPPPVSQPKKRFSTAGTIAVIGLGLFFVVFCLCPLLGSSLWGIDGSSSSSSAPTEDYSGGTSSAYLMCQQFIEKRLVSPATAEWPKVSDIETFTVRDKEDAYQIRGYVDAQNRMSALIRMYYVCEVSYVGNDNWLLDYLKLDE